MKQNYPLVSIMMPVYNGIATLGLATASLLSQTYSNWECIIVNDGSVDGTAEYLDSLNDERFVIIHFKQNKGRPYARQAAMQAVKGVYLAFLDADDFYHPEKLALQVDLLEKYPDIQLVSCANASYDNHLNIITVRGGGNAQKRKYQYGDKLSCALRTSLLRMDLAKNISFNQKLKQAQDTDFLQRYLNDRYYLPMPDVLYYYSEFVSVTGRKILRTYYYSLIHHSGLLKAAFWPNAKSILITIGKGVITALILPFVDVNFFLKRRGRLPVQQEVEMFKKVTLKLNNDYGI